MRPGRPATAIEDSENVPATLIDRFENRLKSIKNPPKIEKNWCFESSSCIDVMCASQQRVDNGNTNTLNVVRVDITQHGLRVWDN